MRITNIENNGKAAHFGSLPEGDDLKALVEILSGKHDLSVELLRNVCPGAVPDQMGAKKTMFVVLDNVPSSDEAFQGGIYSVCDWVVDVLEAAMPDGMGAAVTQTVLFHGLDADTGARIDYFVVISPMDRSETKIRRVGINDPHADCRESLGFSA
ncbi:hypothetical protein ACFL2R_02060 [Patescibacteria group bacterium]